jgi:hypothetical protein
MTKTEALDDISLKKQIIKHLDTGEFFLTLHAAKEQEKDELDLQDILHVLRFGAADKKRLEFHTKSQKWRYAIKGKTEESKIVTVILTFDTKMMIITVFKTGK